MAELRSRLNQAVVTCDDEAAKKLIESGLWEAADAPRKKAPRKAAEAENEE